MTVTAHVRATPDGAEPTTHAATVIEESTDPGEPSIIDVPDFGLYAVGVHPELGPIGMYLVPTPGADPSPAPARIVWPTIEVSLVADAVVLVVEGHPLPDGVSAPEPGEAVEHSAEQPTPEDQA